MLVGDGFGGAPAVEVVRLADAPPRAPSQAGTVWPGKGERAEMLQALLLALPQLARLIGVIERQALDDLVRGPDQERKTEVVARIEAQWPRPRNLCGRATQ
jgi:hypothetical protein